ncbi:MAG: hypothetical protein JXQ25_03345, partial [Deltaproteobacteria bacterium]|nr:hypothetical protein [Deltaproteobacteria bacterium]
PNCPAICKILHFCVFYDLYFYIKVLVLSVVPNIPTSEGIYKAYFSSKIKGEKMYQFLSSLEDLGIFEGNTDFFGDALRDITQEWWYN